MTGDPALAAEWIGVAVFALSGALVAARRNMDPFGFAMLATATGVGGGSLRDALLGLPAFWVRDPVDVVICVAVSVAFFVAGRRAPAFVDAIEGRRALLFADAAGLAIFSVSGAAKALEAGAHPFVAMALGAMTATFGGVIRDVIAGLPSLILHREIYVTAAFLGAAVFTLATLAGAPPALAATAGIAAAFGLRACAILRGWTLPAFSPDRD